MKKRLHLFIVTLITLMLMLTGCATKNDDSNTDSSNTNEHEPLTMMTFTNNYKDFVEALHEVYPEINIEFVSYNGSNSTQYGYTLLEAREITDIFATNMAPSNAEFQVDNFIDLSDQDFISSIRSSLLSDVTVNGSIYMIPTNVGFYGPYYNKTLFDKMGWEVPNSLDELEALIPQIKAAGVTLCETQTQFAGSSFSYFFDTIAPDYLTTLEGQKWMKDFLAGDQTASDYLTEPMALFEHLMDLGLFYIGDTPGADADTQARFKAGNTAFLITNTGCSQAEDGDEYVIMPYLSKDGSNNITVTKVNKYFGISKKLEDNPQKLEDALKVMSFIATPEGQETLGWASNTLSPLKSSTLSEDDPLYAVAKLVDEGQSMTLIYSGWEDYLADVGGDALELMSGNITGSEFLNKVDELQASIIAEGGTKKLADVKENLNKEQVAQIVGAAYAEATGADCSLISIGDYHGFGHENRYAVNGNIYASVKLDNNVVSTFNPLGWNGAIKLLTLTGAKIKEYVNEGYFVDGDETPFEYILVTKDGVELDDDTTYTVAIAKESDARSEEGNMVESEVTGQNAIIDYITKLGTLSTDSLVWK